MGSRLSRRAEGGRSLEQMVQTVGVQTCRTCSIARDAASLRSGATPTGRFVIECDRLRHGSPGPWRLYPGRGAQDPGTAIQMRCLVPATPSSQCL